MSRSVSMSWPERTASGQRAGGACGGVDAVCEAGAAAVFAVRGDGRRWQAMIAARSPACVRGRVVGVLLMAQRLQPSGR